MILAEPTDARQRLGLAGEEVAAETLRKKGYRILARRFRCRLGELDLVAELGGVVVFVEVKCRTGERYGPPSSSVTPVKRERMARVARYFLARNRTGDERCRFDVIEVVLGDREPVVAHLEDAFRLWPTG